MLVPNNSGIEGEDKIKKNVSVGSSDRQIVGNTLRNSCTPRTLRGFGAINPRGFHAFFPAPRNVRDV